MTQPEQPEPPEQAVTPAEQQATPSPDVPSPDAPTPDPSPAPESFSDHVARLVAEGKLTAGEAAELLEPAEAVFTEEERAQSAVQLHKPAAGGVPPHLRVEVSGYSLQVLHDPSLVTPRLSSSREGVLEVRAGPDGWNVEPSGHGLVLGVRAILSVPFAVQDVRAEVSGGNLTLPGCAGAVRVEVGGGNATIGAAGELRAEVSGGNLSVGHVAGALEVEVNGGNITVSSSPSLRAEVNGGQLSWTGCLDRGRHTLEVNGGQATLRLDPASSVDIRAESTLGNVSASFPLERSGNMMERRYRGTLGGGAARLDCEVNAGQIRLVTS